MSERIVEAESADRFIGTIEALKRLGPPEAKPRGEKDQAASRGGLIASWFFGNGEKNRDFKSDHKRDPNCKSYCAGNHGFASLYGSAIVDYQIRCKSKPAIAIFKTGRQRSKQASIRNCGSIQMRWSQLTN